MKKALPIGITNYRELIDGDYYHIDKTLLIKEFLERKSKTTLITRPRRFGKTLNMSMLAEFFDITKDSAPIFEGTKIMQTEYAKEINQYPTIFVTFANAKKAKQSIVYTIKEQICKEYQRYHFVFNSEDEFEILTYNRLKKVLLSEDETLAGIDDSISFLMKMLHKYYNKKVMVFIDEYDTPFIESYVNGFYKDVNTGLSLLLHNSLKTSDYLQFAMLTGIQRVAKENIFSDLNNIVVYTVADKGYNEYFGFTEEETERLLNYYDLELNENVKNMYDGYRIGNIDIYNPWSLINYSAKQELRPYWVNTSSNTMIKSVIRQISQKTSSFANLYEKLVMDGYLETIVSLETSFYENATVPTLWGYFVNAGYLTLEKQIDVRRNKYCIRIPNEEVKNEFINITESYLSLDEGQIITLFDYLIDEDKDSFLISYRTILQIPSYHDLRNENSYHMLMLGMCIYLSDRYEVISNREAGSGRCDIILKAKNTKDTSFVLEFKYQKEEVTDIEKRLKDLSEEAVQQIIDKKYDSALEGKVIYIGLAHYGKEVVMKWQERNELS